MLEVKNLFKVYKSKDGVKVHALDDVSISFGEKGMVFLLGKSGSGKSTLLNVCGGLDNPDSGEIIVNGRSSKSFNESDFDSYRNTFIGFIFQEYNVLNEFSVEDNIALALELQGKTKDKATIHKLLDDVGLSQFAKRKPNTLSGGQRQRVAIARALIKNPQIIMADEPTGALDSDTGKQVFDTLKKLSKDKLVIVVSHDREFAEKYADRIIELKDGKIISDVERTQTDNRNQQNLTFTQEAVFVKSGALLTDAELDKIKKFVHDTKGDVLISNNDQAIKQFAQQNNIKNNLHTQFVDYVEKEKPVCDGQKVEFIRSRLPMKHAFKMGASGIKIKPVRFVFTVLLTVISLVMFGMFSCLMFFKSKEVAVNSLAESGNDFVLMNQSVNISKLNLPEELQYSFVYSKNTIMTDSEIDAYSQKSGLNMLKIYNLSESKIFNAKDAVNQPYMSKITFFVNNSPALQYIEGTAPVGSGEVAITQFLYDSLKHLTITDPQTNDPIAINSYKDIKLNLNGKIVTVSGIVKNQELPKSFYDMLNNPNSSTWLNAEKEGFFSCAVIDDNAYTDFAKALNVSSRDFYPMDYIDSESFYITDGNFISVPATTVAKLPSYVKTYTDNKGNVVQSAVLSDNQALLNTITYATILNTNLQTLYDEYPELYDEMTAPNDYAFSYYKLLEKITDEYSYINPYTVPDILSDIVKIANKYIDIDKLMTLEIKINNAQVTTCKVLGFNSIDTEKMALFVNENAYKTIGEKVVSENVKFLSYNAEYTPDSLESMKYISVFAVTDGSRAQIVKLTNINNADSVLELNITNSTYTNALTIGGIIEHVLAKVFLWVGIVMALFSMMLLSNFISVSIANKKKEIGILRAVGARGLDVFKIFFSESFIIAFICSVASVVFTALLSSSINGIFVKQMSNYFAPFIFGIVPVIMIFAVAFVSATIATFIPVFKASKKKPVDSIRSL